jgi:hypothetical protein
MPEIAKPQDGLMTCACGEQPTHWEINVEKDIVSCVTCGRQYKSTVIMTATPIATSIPQS